MENFAVNAFKAVVGAVATIGVAVGTTGVAIGIMAVGNAIGMDSSVAQEAGSNAITQAQLFGRGAATVALSTIVTAGSVFTVAKLFITDTKPRALIPS